MCQHTHLCSAVPLQLQGRKGSLQHVVPRSENTDLNFETTEHRFACVAGIGRWKRVGKYELAEFWNIGLEITTSRQEKKSIALFWSEHINMCASCGTITYLLLGIGIKQRDGALGYLIIRIANKQIHYFAKSPFQLSSWMILIVTPALASSPILKILRP